MTAAATSRPLELPVMGRHPDRTSTAGATRPLDPGRLLDRLVPAAGDADGPLTHVERVPARTGRTAPWPDWVPASIRAALADRGITAPWTHQARAATLAYEGSHVVVSTGTGSGKSLAYQLPVLSTLLTDARATAVYLAPTKALAADQLRIL